MSRRRHEAKVAWWQQQDNAALTERNEALKENRRLREAVALHRQGPWSTAADSYVCYECARPYPCPTVRAAGLNGEEPG